MYGHATTWYQRDSKSKAIHEFTLRDRKSYTKQAARQKRLDCNKTAAITIRAAYVKKYQSTRYKPSFKLESAYSLVDEDDRDENEDNPE